VNNFFGNHDDETVNSMYAMCRGKKGSETVHLIFLVQQAVFKETMNLGVFWVFVLNNNKDLRINGGLSMCFDGTGKDLSLAGYFAAYDKTMQEYQGLAKIKAADKFKTTKPVIKKMVTKNNNDRWIYTEPPETDLSFETLLARTYLDNIGIDKSRFKIFEAIICIGGNAKLQEKIDESTGEDGLWKTFLGDMPKRDQAQDYLLTKLDDGELDTEEIAKNLEEIAGAQSVLCKFFKDHQVFFMAGFRFVFLYFNCHSF